MFLEKDIAKTMQGMQSIFISFLGHCTLQDY